MNNPSDQKAYESCCAAYDRGHHCDCSPCGRCAEGKLDYGGNPMAEHVPIVDNPEEYKRQREAAGLCSDCGGDRGAHFSSCPRIAAAFAASAPQPLYPNVQPHTTAYDRAQAIIVDELRAAHSRVNDAHNRINVDAEKHNRLCDVVAEHMSRLDAALRRIEALELEVARLKAYPTANIERIRDAVAKHNWDEASKVLPDEGT